VPTASKRPLTANRRLSTAWLWLAAASLLALGLALVGVNGSLEADMSAALGNERIHIEKMTAVRRGARSTHVALLERWLNPANEYGQRQRAIENGVAAVRRGIDEFATLERVSAAEDAPRNELVIAVAVWSNRVLQALIAADGPASTRELRACLDAIDKTSDAVLAIVSKAGSRSDNRVVVLLRAQARMQVAFLLVAVGILTLAIAWWRRYVASERGRAENEHSAQLRSQFFANMSHELRTPLIAIRGFATVVEEHERADETLRNAACHIDREAQDLLTAISNILDASKLEAGKVQLLLEDVSLEPIIVRCVQRCRGLVGLKPVAIEVDVARELPEVRADVVKLQQVMTNLLANAIKYTDRGSVCIRARQADAGHVVIEVVDTGIGIQPEALDRVWKPFEQGDIGNSRRGGTGLGLSIVRAIVELLHGDVRIESTLGEGTRVTVVLPCAKHAKGIPDAVIGNEGARGK
jgi:signal transduction histidine kinase